MNVQDYIDSGVLYDYAMGTLADNEKSAVEKVCSKYPEVKSELQHLQQAIENHVAATAISPVAAVQESIWNTLENINREKTGDINERPVVNKYSDYNNWKRIVMPFMPKEFNKDRVMKTIRDSDGVTQILVITKTDVEEEVHERERECFLVLEGECECHIGSDVYRVGPGGFIDVPMHTTHNVRIVSPYVVAVLQHVAL